jgi:hypothetical protein
MPASCCAISPRGRKRSGSRRTATRPGRTDFRRRQRGCKRGGVSVRRDGKPLYIPGPFDSPSLIRRHIEQLQKHLGEGGFEFETAA